MGAIWFFRHEVAGVLVSTCPAASAKSQIIALSAFSLKFAKCTQFREKFRFFPDVGKTFVSDVSRLNIEVATGLHLSRMLNKYEG